MTTKNELFPLACPQCGQVPDPHWVEVKGKQTWRVHCPDVFAADCSKPLGMFEGRDPNETINRWNEAVKAFVIMSENPEFANAVKAVRGILTHIGIKFSDPEVQGDFDQDDDGKDLPAMNLENWSLGVATVNFAKEGEIPNRDYRVGFTIQKVVTIPGCRTLPNGDPGYPDDCDLVDVEVVELAQWFKAAEQFCRHFITEAVDTAVELYGEDLRAEEWAKDEAERTELETKGLTHNEEG